TKVEQRHENHTNILLLPALVWDFVSRVKINLRPFDLKLAHRWAVASSVQAGGSGGADVYKVVFVELTEVDGTTGIGEAAPSARYEENADSALAFLERVDPDRLSFVDVPGSMKNLAALREVAPKKPVRVDANEGWKTKEEALRQFEWLAADGHIQFVEQPMPATTDPKDLIWLKNRSPLPIMADESYLSAKDIDR